MPDNTIFDLSIVVVNWNVRDLLRDCLRSVFAETKNISFEVWVVDNNSRDQSAEMVAQEFPQVHLIANKDNAGFARANNQATRQSRGRHILLLNPDTVVLDDALSKMVHFMDDHPDTGVASCQLLNTDRTIQSSVRRFPTVASQIFILLKLHHFFPRFRPFRSYMATDFNYEEEQEVDQVMGAFFMIPKKVIDSVGLLDEGYRIWFEEVDYCQRVRAHGLKVVYTPMTRIVHHHGQSFRKLMALPEQRIWNRSLRRYFSKFGSPFDRFLLMIAIPISLALAVLVQFMESLRSIGKEKKMRA